MNIVVLTGLPFRKHGNKSMKRFFNMLTDNGNLIELFTSGNDEKENDKISFDGVSSVKLFSLVEKINSLRGNRVKSVLTDYSRIESKDIIKPYGGYNLKVFFNKWTMFFLNLIDNILILFNYRVRSSVKRADLVVGYEVKYTFASKILSVLYRKKYINKFQGTGLKVSNRSLLDCFFYHPIQFFGINKADLTIMVNDGTDGEFYCNIRGCNNIFFEPHGVKELDSSQLNLDKGFRVFNNASAASWKRVDRVIRACSKISPEIRKDIEVLTTYYGNDRPALVELAKKLNVDDCIVFLDDVDSHLSQEYIKKSNAVIMSNDMSNLGNPVLEAIYFDKFVISLNDGSLNGFVENNINGRLIDIDDTMDYKIAEVITGLYKGEFEYNKPTVKNVYSLKEQQSKEYNSIVNCCAKA